MNLKYDPLRSIIYRHDANLFVANLNALLSSSRLVVKYYKTIVSVNLYLICGPCRQSLFLVA